MKVHVWKTVGGLLFCVGASALASAGCSSSSTPVSSSVPANCTTADVGCTGDAVGYACDTGDNPEKEDPTLSCSTPTLSAGEDDYCCFTGFTGSSTTCSQDDSLTTACPDADSYGYQCASASDDPTSLDGSLSCSNGVPDSDGTHTDFCCTLN
jgi:hypothetical protein